MLKTRNIIFSLFLLLSVNLNAQVIEVEDFQPTDELTAQKRSTEKWDENGKRYALIRVQTTQKGFIFDVGSLGVEVDEDHVAEIWVYAGNGARSISIKHQVYGSLADKYFFPEPLKGGRTYIMKIKYDQGIFNAYDNTHHQQVKIKVFPTSSLLKMNGIQIPLNENGETNDNFELPFGTHQYVVESENYYKKDSIITINDDKTTKELSISLVPITGFLKVEAKPLSAKVVIDGVIYGQANKIEPFELQIGEHSVKIMADGFKEETKNVKISEKATNLLSVELSSKATFKISSIPSNAYITIDKEYIGATTCFKELVTGLHNIKATKAGYKDYHKELHLNSSNPFLEIALKKIYNYKNEFYIEGNVKAGSILAYGASIGCFIHNFNLELSYLIGSDKSETVYWSEKNSQPVSCSYSPSMNVSAKIGWGIPISTRFRLTPQVGMNLLKLTESMDDSSNVTPADGAYVTNGIVSLRFSAALVNHLSISITPEYSFAMSKSNGYTVLSDIAPKIKKWGEGFNVKIGMSVFF